MFSRLGPNDILVRLLEEVVNSFQVCGVLGQLNLREVEIGGKTYNKEHYLTIFRTAYGYGGMCGKSMLIIETTFVFLISSLYEHNLLYSH